MKLERLKLESNGQHKVADNKSKINGLDHHSGVQLCEAT